MKESKDLSTPKYEVRLNRRRKYMKLAFRTCRI